MEKFIDESPKSDRSFHWGKIRMKMAVLSVCFIPLTWIFFFFAPQALAEDFKVEKATKETVLTGYTRSREIMTLSSEVSGRILAVNYEIGDTVESKPFASVDPTFINFQIESTRKSLGKLETALKKVRARVEYLEKEFIRIDTLHKGNRATEVKRDAAEQELIQARLEKDTVELEQAILRTTLKELEERRRRHEILARKGWVIVEKRIEQGEMVAPNTPVGRVADFQALVVPLSVSAEELSAIKKLPYRFDAFLEDKTVQTAVRWINPEFDEKTRKLAIELVILDYSGEKRGGLRFSLPLKIPSQGIQIPKEAVTNRYQNPRVTLAETGETVNVIILGETNGHFIISEQENKLKPGTKLLSGDAR